MHRRIRSAGLCAAFVPLVLGLAACSHSTNGMLPPGAATASQPTTKSPDARVAAPAVFTAGATALSLTPNFRRGYGAVICAGQGCRVQPAPADTLLGGGVIDFGNVMQGYDYLYRYAMRVAVTAPSSWTLFGEVSSSNVTSTSGSFSSDALSYLPTTYSAQNNKDTNLPFMASTPFQVVGGGDAVAHGNGGSSNLDFDYILRVPETAALGSYSIQVVYTVVP